MRLPAAAAAVLILAIAPALADAHNDLPFLCYDGSEQPQFAMHLRQLSTGLVTFEACDISPFDSVGEWGGPCGGAVFAGVTAVGQLEGELRVQSDCGEPIGTAAATAMALKDLLITSEQPASLMDVAINLVVSSTTNCDFNNDELGDDSVLTISYRFDEMLSGVPRGEGHIHVPLGDPSAIVTTGTLSLPVNRQLRMAMAAGIIGDADVGDDESCVTTWQISFPQGSPVMAFDGTGFSLDSPQASIVDNVWAPTLPCAADLDGSGVIDTVDLLQLLAGWGTHGPGAAIAAPTDVIEIGDLLGLIAMWGGCS